jgi:hypothetical protein
MVTMMDTRSPTVAKGLFEAPPSRRARLAFLNRCRRSGTPTGDNQRPLVAAAADPPGGNRRNLMRGACTLHLKAAPPVRGLWSFAAAVFRLAACGGDVHCYVDWEPRSFTSSPLRPDHAATDREAMVFNQCSVAIHVGD